MSETPVQQYKGSRDRQTRKADTRRIFNILCIATSFVNANSLRQPRLINQVREALEEAVLIVANRPACPKTEPRLDRNRVTFRWIQPGGWRHLRAELAVTCFGSLTIR
jgi:hypothetical protein